MEHSLFAVKDRLYRAFDKVTAGTLIVSAEGQGMDPASAEAAAKLAEAILKIENRLGAGAAANQNAGRHAGR